MFKEEVTNEKKIPIFSLIILLCFANNLYGAESSSDAPEYSRNSTIQFKSADSYEQVLQIWKTPEDINKWIAANFSYNKTRAVQLSETQRVKNVPSSIYHPSEFFTHKMGVCVDLSRFAVETLKRIDPHSEPKYLMIQFDPIQISGNTLRLHWLASFKRDGKHFYFADSKRPGYIAGPFNNTQEFINKYEKYRNRKIVSFRELESYQKKRRFKKQKRQTSSKNPIKKG